MSQPLDNIIFVGFPVPDRSTENGESAYRHIMDTANVPKDRIFFYPAETGIIDIVRGTFPLDKSQKYDYRIGNSLVIGSDELEPTYRLKLEILQTKMDISVKTGYQTVDLSLMTEAETAEWLRTARYRKIESSNEDSADTDLMLENLLLGSDETPETEPEKEESSPPVSEESPEEYEYLYTSSIPQDDGFDFDDLMGDFDISTDSVAQEPEPVLPSSEESSAPELSQDDIDDLFADDTSHSTPESVPESPVSHQNAQNKPESIPHQSTAQAGSHAPSWEHVDARKEQEKQSQEKSVSESAFNDIPLGDTDIADDDMEYVNRMERERERAERRKQIQEQENLKLDEEMFYSNKDDFGERVTQMNRQASAATENRYREDGTTKNYLDYLDEDAARHQKVAERTREKFGDINLNMGDKDKNPDLNYVGEGKGRIILCTSGKGGVGKSMVANGMAMALSLARAKDIKDNPGASTARTWLIESDYNSPQLAVAFSTGNKNLGNVAARIGNGNHADTNTIRRAIEDNAYVDDATGIHVLACPPLSSRQSSREIPYAILLAVKYASDQGDDVIIDHGNLTSGEHSELDQVLSLQLANRVVVVGNMGCIPETQSALYVLCDRDRNSVIPSRPVPSVSVVLNSARKEQYQSAQDMLAPFEIINVIPPIDAFRAENSLKGTTYLPEAPKEVQKAIIDRCGIMLTKLGYESMRKYFMIKSSFNPSKKNAKQGIIRKLSDFLSGSK